MTKSKIHIVKSKSRNNRLNVSTIGSSKKIAEAYKPVYKNAKVKEDTTSVKEPFGSLKGEDIGIYTGTLGIAIENLYGKKSNSNSMFEKLFKDTHLPIKTLAEQVFELTPKTLNSYRASGRNIPMHVRELSIKLNELYAKGNRVFGSIDSFNDWLKKKSYGLGGLIPIELLNTVTGIEMISDELVSIEFGTTA
jgi:Protein of unknown function (DUF2384).